MLLKAEFGCQLAAEAGLRGVSVVLRPWNRGDASALSEAFQNTPDLSTQFGGADLSTRTAAEAFIDQSLRFDERVKN